MSMFQRGNGQSILPNFCDSLILTKAEFEKCKLDSNWTRDIVVKVNYISRFKTEFLPKFKAKRRSIILPGDLLNDVKNLKRVYDSVLQIKIQRWESDMYRIQLGVQPKAYISTQLSLNIFKFYPDVYAILLNDLHLELSPIIQQSDLDQFTMLFEKVNAQITSQLRYQVSTIIQEMNRDRRELGDFIYLFQGEISETLRNDCQVISFLMWGE